MEEKPDIKIVFDENLPDNFLVREIMKRAERFSVEVIEGDYTEEGATGRLYLSSQKGFIRPCPCSRKYRCCNYFTIDTIEGCLYDCEYCALKIFIDRTKILIKVDVDEMIMEMRRFMEMAHSKGRTIRIGTGELSDSLALEWIAPFAPILIEETKDSESLILEFKTRSTEISTLIGLPHNSRTTVSFSLSTEYLKDVLERNTPSIGERILAAKRLLEDNYRVGFHLDPIIYYDSYERDYEGTIRLISENIPYEAISWISMGTIRFNPDLINEFRSPVLFGEYVLDADKKYRYPYILRKEIYKKVYRLIRDYLGSRVRVYLCMESDSMNEAILLKRFRTDDEMNRYIISL
jgi:spore photoproduct lyase